MPNVQWVGKHSVHPENWTTLTFQFFFTIVSSQMLGSARVTCATFERFVYFMKVKMFLIFLY